MVTAFHANSQTGHLQNGDDISPLKSGNVQKKGLQKIKNIPLSRKTRLSFGGALREQLQYHDNINFGDVPANYKTSNTWQHWHRLMIHADYKVDEKTRLFTQFGSTYRFLNPNPLTPEIEQNELSLHQAFIDRIVAGKWSLKIGRQELSYGSHRLITFREGPNTRLSFDGAMIRYTAEKRKIDLIALSPVISRKGVFDDETSSDLIWGIYASEQPGKLLSFEYYFLNFSSTRRQYRFVSGNENRKIIGFRFYGNSSLTNYELEGTYQFGKFNALRINAFSISADIHHRIHASFNLVIGFSGNYVSGDRNPNDPELNTYNLLYSKPQYGLTAPIGATNIITMNPYFKISPTNNFATSFKANFLWRQSAADGVYNPAGGQTRPRAESNTTSVEKQIGTLLTLNTNYVVNANLSFSIDASRFFAGSYVKQTGAGRNILHLSLKASFRF